MWFVAALESSVTPSSAAKEKEKDKDSAHRTVYAQPFSAELFCPDWHLHYEGFQLAVDEGFQLAVDEGTNTGKVIVEHVFACCVHVYM